MESNNINYVNNYNFGNYRNSQAPYGLKNPLANQIVNLSEQNESENAPSNLVSPLALGIIHETTFASNSLANYDIARLDLASKASENKQLNPTCLLANVLISIPEEKEEEKNCWLANHLIELPSESNQSTNTKTSSIKIEPTDQPQLTIEPTYKQTQQFSPVSAEEILSLKKYISNPNPKHINSIDFESLLSIHPESFPSQKIEIDNATYFVSRPFKLNLDNRSASGDRWFAFCLIKIGDNVYPRILYCSQSQQSWRVLSAAMKFGNDQNPTLGWFFKGIKESDTQVPIFLNIELSHQLPLPTQKQNLEVPLKTQQEKPVEDNSLKHKNKFLYVAMDLIKTLNPADSSIMANSYETFVKCKSLDISNSNIEPEFSEVLLEKQISSVMYGPLTAKVYLSKSKEIRYLFLEAEDGRAFIGGVEYVNDSPITKYGNRQYFVDLQEQQAPLLEYRQQIAKECFPNNRDYKYQGTHHYLCNWNFVRTQKYIIDYYLKQGREIPAAI